MGSTTFKGMDEGLDNYDDGMTGGYVRLFQSNIQSRQLVKWRGGGGGGSVRSGHCPPTVCSVAAPKRNRIS